MLFLDDIASSKEFTSSKEAVHKKLRPLQAIFCQRLDFPRRKLEMSADVNRGQPRARVNTEEGQHRRELPFDVRYESWWSATADTPGRLGIADEMTTQDFLLQLHYSEHLIFQADSLEWKKLLTSTVHDLIVTATHLIALGSYFWHDLQTRILNEPIETCYRYIK